MARARSPRERRKAVEKVAAGSSVAEVGRELQVSSSTVRRWVRATSEKTPAVEEVDDQFARGGRALYAALHRASDPVPVQALVVEAARIKDRLDLLHRLTAGEVSEWMRLFSGDEAGAELVVKLDSAVSEQRQLTTVFRQLLAEIQRRQGDDGSNSDEPDDLSGI